MVEDEDVFVRILLVFGDEETNFATKVANPSLSPACNAFSLDVAT